MNTRLDHSALDAMKTLGQSIGKDLVKELTLIFIEKTPSVLNDMQMAQIKKDKKLISEKAHYLKSSAGSLGAMKLFEMCKHLEKSAKTIETNDFESEIHSIRLEYLAVESELRKYSNLS